MGVLFGVKHGNQAMKQNVMQVREDPDQTFFDFFEKPAPPPVPAVSAVAPSSISHLIAERHAPRMARPGNNAMPVPAAGAFMTESRASQLFVQAAAAAGRASIRRARVVFKPFRTTLYSFKISRSGMAQVKFHVAFRSATEEVISQAAQLMLCRGRGTRRELRRAEYDAFVRAIPAADFELPGARKGRQISVEGPGVHRSLEESFARVNAEYFHSQLAQPQLCWSPVQARRILGSYQERSDRLIISQLFDSPRVPLYVLDYLMFHELLHKFLGIGRREDGKRCMHGREFREIEKKFRHFKDAQQFLKKL